MCSMGWSYRPRHVSYYLYFQKAPGCFYSMFWSLSIICTGPVNSAELGWIWTQCHFIQPLNKYIGIRYLMIYWYLLMANKQKCKKQKRWEKPEHPWTMWCSKQTGKHNNQLIQAMSGITQKTERISKQYWTCDNKTTLFLTSIVVWSH